MLLYNTQRAVLKGGERSTLLCNITLPCGTDDKLLNDRISRFYKDLYSAIYSLAKAYIGSISPPNGRLATLDIRCEERVKRGKLSVKRTCVVSCAGVVLKKRVFVDKFSINMTKQRNIP